MITLGTAFVVRAVAIGEANVVYDVITGGQRVTGSLPVSVVVLIALVLDRGPLPNGSIIAADLGAQHSVTGKAQALRPRS